MEGPDTSTNASKDEKRTKVIEVLNKARSMELYAIIQYMYQHYSLADEDYGQLAKEMRDVAIQEMRHAEWLAERIFDLDGDPTTKHDGNFTKGLEARDIYPFDMDVEADTLEKYNEFIKVCRENGDNVSEALFKRIIVEEQDHWNYFDDTNTHIKKLGDHFLAKMAGGEAD